jgi:HEAT repeat protein
VKGIELQTRWLLTLAICGFIACSLLSRAAAEEEPAIITPISQEDPARQFRIYREALLQGSSEEIRVDAAVGLLLNRDETSQALLVSSLRLSDNSGAVKAVCRALIKSRAVGATIGSRDVFLEPLLELLAGADTDLSRLSSEALLVFRYRDIEERLYELSHNALLDKRVRYNVIYALQIRPEPEALSSLIKLLDEPDSDVARAAETSLQEAFGIPVGTGRAVWEQILNDLKQKSPDDIRRERLLRQEMKLREMQAERDRWQRLYLGVLDKQYETADETQRNAMTLESLDSDLPAIRLWALDKIDRIPAASQAALRDKLLALLGNESRLVRLKTAKVLNNMSILNPAEKLLERFRLERDSEVALAMFEALGEACFFAFSPGSKIELPADVKLQTLEIAGGYLNSEDIETAKKGAEILRKLLELDGLPQDVADRNLGLFVACYNLSVQRNSLLRADLLGMMARLSGRGAQRERAARLFLQFFVEGLGVPDNPAVRLSAATGLSNLDKAEALKLYKKHNVMQDASPALRQLVFDAAGQAGKAEDLDWLASYLSSNGQSESALQAFRAICQRSGGQIVLEWADRFDREGIQTALVRELLEFVEQTAIAEKNDILLSESRVRLAEWFVRRQTPDQLAAYLDKLKATGGSLVFPDATGARLIEALAFAGYYDAAAAIVKVRLERASLRKDSLILDKLEEYFQSGQVNVELKRELFAKLSVLKVDPANPLWSSKLKSWQEYFASMSKEDDMAD